jgi:hypothetical protein
MNARNLTGAVYLTSALLLGCDQPVEPTRSTVAPSATADHPVAAAPAAPSVPPAELAWSTPKSSSDASKETAVTRAERDEEMRGQANDHSTPEFAKRG